MNTKPDSALARVEAELRDQRQQMRDLFAQMPVPCVVTDSAGIVIDANPAAEALLRSTLQEIHGRPMTQFVGREDRIEFRKHMSQAKHSPSMGEWRWTVTAADGIACDVVTNISLVVRPGEPVEMRWFLRQVAVPNKSRPASYASAHSDRSITLRSSSL